MQPPRTPPALCLVEPDRLDLQTDPSGWDKITIHGYDLDHRDGSGNLLGYALADGNGVVVAEIPESSIARGTHYKVTVGIRPVVNRLHRDNIAKIVPVWGGTTEGTTQGEVLVSPWRPKRTPILHSSGETTFTPPLTNGDRDFNTSGGHTGPRGLGSPGELS